MSDTPISHNLCTCGHAYTPDSGPRGEVDRLRDLLYAVYQLANKTGADQSIIDALEGELIYKRGRP